MAQVQITGKITGVVTDPSGAAVPGARVEVQSPALMAPRTVTTQAKGNYLFNLLPPGTYDVSVTRSGFKAFQRKGIVITAGFTATVNISLQVGAVNQSVTVSGATPAVDVTDAAPPTTLSATMLHNIPVGHDPWSLVESVPGSTTSTFDVAGDNGFQQASMEIHGSEANQSIYALNGLDLNWPGSNGGYAQFYINYDALQEFNVITDTTPANVGPSGVYMNMVTKSGSNKFHGDLTTSYSTAAFGATPGRPLYKGTPITTGSKMIQSLDNSVGVGGPFITNKLWWYINYRHYQNRLDQLAIINQNTGQPFFDTNHQWNIDTRTDYQINSKNRFSFIWIYNAKNRFFRRDEGFSFVTDQAAYYQHLAAYILEGLYTSTLTPNLLLSARFGYVQQRSPYDYQPSVGPNSYTIQDITLSTMTGAALHHELDRVPMKRYSVGMTYFKGNFLGGSHDLDFGVEGGANPDGDAIDIINGLYAIYNSGVPFEVRIWNTPVNYVSEFHDTEAFITDAWTIKKRLTLNIGGRFEHWRGFNPAQSSPSTGPFVAQFTAPRSFPEQDVVEWNNFAPRASAAFDITGKGTSVLRFGYGRYYLMQGDALVAAVNQNGDSSQYYLWNGAKTSNGLPDPAEFLTPANFVSSTGGVFTHIDPNIQRPYSREISVGYQQSVWQGMAVGVTYYYRTIHNLYATRNLANPTSAYTPITSIGSTPIVNPYTNQPMTLYNLDSSYVGLTNNVVTTIPALNNNSYNGIEFDIKKHMSHRWQLLAGFTIQKKKGTYTSGTSDNFNDPNLNINRANSYLGLDSTYVFKLSGTYEWPVAGLLTSVNFQHFTGYPILPTNVFTGLNQHSETVKLAPNGNIRLPAINLLNLRVSRPIRVFHERVSIEPNVDLYNVLNKTTSVSQVSSYGANFLRPTDNLEPFMARVGLSVHF